MYIYIYSDVNRYRPFLSDQETIPPWPLVPLSAHQFGIFTPNPGKHAPIWHFQHSNLSFSGGAENAKLERGILLGPVTSNWAIWGLFVLPMAAGLLDSLTN